MNTRLRMQQGSHHIVLVAIVMVGLIGVLGYLGYNSWAKKNANAGGTSLIGREVVTKGSLSNLKADVVFSSISNKGNQNYLAIKGTKRIQNLESEIGPANILDATTVDATDAAMSSWILYYNNNYSGDTLHGYGIKDKQNINYNVPAYVPFSGCDSSSKSPASAKFRDGGNEVLYLERKLGCVNGQSTFASSSIYNINSSAVKELKYPKIKNAYQIIYAGPGGIAYTTGMGFGNMVTSTDGNGAATKTFQISNENFIRADNNAVYIKDTSLYQDVAYAAKGYQPAVNDLGNYNTKIVDIDRQAGKILYITQGDDSNTLYLKSGQTVTELASLGNTYRDFTHVARFVGSDANQVVFTTSNKRASVYTTEVKFLDLATSGKAPSPATFTTLYTQTTNQADRGFIKIYDQNGV